MYRCLYIVFFASIVSATCTAQTQTTYRPLSLSAVLSGRYLQPSSEFGGIPSFATCCDGLGSGNGFGGALLVGVTLQEPHDELTFDLLGGVSLNNLQFSKDEFIGWALVGTGSQARVDSAVSRSTMTLATTSAEARLQATYSPKSLGGFGISGGATGLFHFVADADQSESLVQPSNAVYTDTKTRDRLVASASITDKTQPWIAGYVAATWKTLLSEKLLLRTGFAYEMPFTSVVSRDQRKVDMGMFRLDVGITLLSVIEKAPESPVIESTPVPSTPATWLSNAITVNELRRDGTLNDIAIVRIEETLSKQIYPLLPYVFFQENESALDANKYVNLVPKLTRTFNEKVDFTFDRAKSDTRSAITMEMYYNILNIVGRRMRDELPSSTLVLQGYNNGRSNERGDTILSRRRAESVKDYLVRIWGIDAKRISTQSGNLSPRAALTNMSDERDREDGFEENRRVEIIPSDSRLLDPVVVNDTLREINVPALRYTLEVQGNVAVSQWNLEALHPFVPVDMKNGTMMQRQGSGAPPDYVDWKPGDSQREIPKSSDPVVAAFVVNGPTGETDTAANRMPVEYISIARKLQERIGNLSVGRYRLPLFAYGNDKLLVAQADIIDRYVKPELDQTATILVQAFTDRKGTTSLNQTLSQQRADQIRTLISNVPAIAVEGFGEGTSTQAAPFTNDSPEGRLYNRTVEVTVFKRID